MDVVRATKGCREVWWPVGAGFHGMGIFSYIMEGFVAWFHGIGIFPYIMENSFPPLHDIQIPAYIMEFQPPVRLRLSPIVPWTPASFLHCPLILKMSCRTLCDSSFYIYRPFRVYSFHSIRRNYSMISVTTPEPTVLPPSLMANLSPSSIAIGVIRSISITTLSPGMHISVPSGSFRSPVTSVVLK